tara:strand:+ start:646 stop:1338 length:693 start_codon:yes stop_codon:yes gene_type:complete
MPTTVINASKTGQCIGQSSTTFATARQTGNSVTANPSTTVDRAISYTASSGRGALTHAMRRVFYYFDTSAVTGTVSSSLLKIRGVTNNSADVIVLKSTAFGGNGSSNLATSDFFSTIDYSTAYSSEYDSWTATGDNLISLNSTANTDIQNNDAFIFAIVQHTNDFGNTAAGSATTDEAGIHFGVTATLTVAEASSGRSVGRIGKYTKDQVARFDKYSLADIASINGVDIG